jgi:ABC-type transporter Mla subunit MlaD
MRSHVRYTRTAMPNAAKVGLLVVIFVGLLLGAFQMLGQRLFKVETIKVYAEFPDAGGINTGAKVLMAGVKIGQVERIELVDAKMARLTLAIEKDKQIPAGSTATLPTSLIGFGDNPISIIPPSQTSTAFLEDGSTIRGSKLGALEGIVPDLTGTVEEVNKTLASVRKLIEDGEMQEQLVAVLKQSQDTLAQFSRLAGTANQTMDENRGTIKSTLNTFAVAMKDVQRTTALAAEMLADPRYKDQAAEILANLNATSKKADQMMGDLQALVADPNLKNQIDSTLSNVNKITDSGTRIASNTEEITKNGVTISENVAELTAKANELADEAKEVFEKLKGFFERTPVSNPAKGLGFEADLYREFEPGRYRADLVGKIPVSGGTVYAGVYDAFESKDFTLQIGRPFGSNHEYRYGIFGGQPGLGVDFSLAPNVRLRGDLYGLNDPRLDTRLQYRFKSDLLGWLGLHRVGDRNTVTAGIGIRK